MSHPLQYEVHYHAPLTSVRGSLSCPTGLRRMLDRVIGSSQAFLPRAHQHDSSLPFGSGNNYNARSERHEKKNNQITPLDLKDTKETNNRITLLDLKDTKNV